MNEKVIRLSETGTIAARLYAKGWNACLKRWLEEIELLTSLQPEIIKCKDCRFRDDNKNCYVSNFKAGLPCMIRWVKDSDYCSMGERKINGSD